MTGYSNIFPIENRLVRIYTVTIMIFREITLQLTKCSNVWLIMRDYIINILLIITFPLHTIACIMFSVNYETLYLMANFSVILVQYKICSISP